MYYLLVRHLYYLVIKVVDGLFADGGVPKNEPPGAEDWYPQLRWLDNNLPGFRD